MDNLMGTHSDEMALALGSFSYDLRIGKGSFRPVVGMLHEILSPKITMHARATLCLELKPLIYVVSQSESTNPFCTGEEDFRYCQIFADIIYEWPLNP